MVSVRKSSSVAVVVLAALLLAGCGAINIESPATGATVGSPVSVVITWADMQGGPELEIDGADYTSQVQVSSGGNRATASIPLAAGSHNMTAWGRIYCSYCTGDKYPRQGTTNHFTVTGGNGGTVTPALKVTLQPSNLMVERGQSGTIVVSVARTNWSGDVVVQVSGLPSGVTASPLTISAAQSSGTLKLSADARAAVGKQPVNVTAAATAGTPKDTQPLNLHIARINGPFSEVAPDFATVGGSKSSPDGTYSVAIKTGAQVALPSDLAAVFQKGNQVVGQPVGFAIGPTSNLGGAGFCAASTWAVVLSGKANQMGSSSEYLFKFFDLAGNPGVVREWPANGLKQLYFFQPRVYLSPDCSVAFVAGANLAGSSNNVLRVIDLVSGNPVGSDVPFNGSSFGATLKIVNGQQIVEVTTDGQTQSFVLP